MIGLHPTARRLAGLPRMRRTHPRGFIFITVLLTVTFLAMFTMMGMQRSMTNQLAARRSLAQQQEDALAEAAIDCTLRWLSTRPTFPATGACGPGPNTPCFVVPTCAAVSPIPGSSYAAVVYPDQKRSGSTIVSATGYAQVLAVGNVPDNGTVNGGPVQGVLWLTLRPAPKKSFASFLMYQDLPSNLAYMDPPQPNYNGGWGIFSWRMVYQDGTHNTNFITGHRLNGPVHLNNTMNIDGNPNFLGTTSTAGTISCAHGCPPYDPWVDFGGVVDSPIFAQPPQTGVAQIPMPDANTTMSSLQANAGVTLGAGSHIRFNGNQMTVTDALGFSSTVAVPNGSVVYVPGDAYIDGGRLDGAVTVAADGDLLITDSVVYNCDPRTPTTAACIASGNDDVLGMVARRNVRIPPFPFAVNPSWHMQIHGSVMALEGTFRADDCCGTYYPDGNRLTGTLDSLGGTIVKKPGVIGMYNASTGQDVAGFAPGTDDYDPRYNQGLAPPYFPSFTPAGGGNGATTGDYQTVMWQGN